MRTRLVVGHRKREGVEVLLKIGKFNDHTVSYPMEYEVLFFQFACDLLLATEEAKDKHFGMGMGVKTIRTRRCSRLWRSEHKCSAK